MKREPRGFHYALDPLRKKCEWELRQLRLDLADLHAQVGRQAETVQECELRLSTANAELARQRGETQIFFADRQQNANAYLAREASLLKQARQVLAELESKRDAMTQELYRLHKFADGLEENRDEEIASHLKVVEKAGIAEADDAWLRGMKWRASQ